MGGEFIMHKFIGSLAILTTIFYSGCTEYSQPKPEKKTEIILLSEQVQELDTKDKQLIYRSIQDDINKYNKDGDEAYEYGYNYDAIKAYELVNFYEGYAFISKNKISNIKKIAKVKSKSHYKKAVKYSKTDNKKAIAEFNSVMKNNPEYKDTQKRLAILNSDRDIIIYLNSLESSLHTKILNCGGTIEELRDINSKLHELLKYEYKNSVALKARDMLKEYNEVLVKSAIDIYDSGKIKKAEKRFNHILTIYKNDATSLEYLEKIKVKKSIQKNLYLAKKQLSKKEYIESIKYARNVLVLDPKNKKAKSLIKKAKVEARKKVTILVNRGKKQYNDKKLDESRESFNQALKIDPYSNAALIYSKKIDRQLETIQSLQ